MSRHDPANTSLSRTTLFIAFGISGLAALIFELVWTRLLLLSLGTTAAAVGVVLGAFMGGMAAGSAIAGHRSMSRLDPILAFACLEGWIGLYALGSPTLLSFIDAVGHRGAQFGLALALLVPATAAMGASLPVLARVVGGDGARRSVTIGRLYAANTAGAVLGPVLAVTWLFPAVGLSTTLLIGASLDLSVCLGMWLLRKREGARLISQSPPASEDDVPASSAELSRASLNVPWPLGAAMAVSGASAMVYQVAWGRTLSMVYGSSVYGVAIMLSTFLFGITAGSVLASWWLARRAPKDPWLRVAQLLMGSAVLAFVSLIISRSLPFLFLNFYTSVDGNDSTLFVSQFVISALLMLPSTMALGGMLPFTIYALPEETPLGASLARLYSWNLVGSTIGAISASVLLLASLGVEFSIRAAALIALAMAILVATKASRFSMATGAVAGSAMLIILALDPSGERSLKSFGIYSGARTYATYDLTKLRQLVEAHELLYYRDGPTATVAVQQIDRFRLLKINGKTDASNGPGDVETQLLLGHVPFLMRDADDVAVIGWGSGMTVDAVLKHPVERVTAFEIEPAVVEASRFFEPGNGAPLEDERVELIMGDARNELRRRQQLYDVIISEPSNPWLTGVANLFTKDFFEIAASRLAPDGVMCQWFHLYGMSEDSTRSLIATFREQFPHVIAFKDRDLILLGSSSPIRLSLERLQEFYSDPALKASLARAGMAYPSDILVNVTLDSDGAEAYASEGAINTDDNMRLELAAPKSLYRDEVDAIVASLRRHPPDILRHLDSSGPASQLHLELAASFFTSGKLEQALDHSRQSVELDPSFEAQKMLGQILQRMGRGDEAEIALERALDAGGDSEGRRFVEAMLRSLRSPPSDD